ncbi:hypothetical protein HMPREF9554_00318 [Treponema phagedenis F0421]|nr:hypothetical protein HMPREF9554_00318 [Treponema phagedenis F0421]
MYTKPRQFQRLCTGADRRSLGEQRRRPVFQAPEHPYTKTVYAGFVHCRFLVVF